MLMFAFAVLHNNISNSDDRLAWSSAWTIQPNRQLSKYRELACGRHRSARIGLVCFTRKPVGDRNRSVVIRRRRIGKLSSEALRFLNLRIENNAFVQPVESPIAATFKARALSNISPKAIGESRTVQSQSTSRPPSASGAPRLPRQVSFTRGREREPMATIAASPPDHHGPFQIQPDSGTNSPSSQSPGPYLVDGRGRRRRDSQDSQITVGIRSVSRTEDTASIISRASRTNSHASFASIAPVVPDKEKKKGLSALSGLLRRKQHSIPAVDVPSESCLEKPYVPPLI